MVTAFLASLMFAHAHTPAPFQPDPKFFGHYEGVCQNPDRGIPSPTLVSVTLTKNALLMTVPMPLRKKLDFSTMPGRIWTVHFSPSLIRRVPDAKYCLEIQQSPSIRRPMATVCFERDRGDNLLKARIKPAHENLLCGGVDLIAGQGVSKFAETHPYTPKLGLPVFDLERLIARTQNQANELRFSVAPSTERSFKLSEAHTRFDTNRFSEKIHALNAAGASFLGGDLPDQLARAIIIRRGLADPEPGVRVAAFEQIALYAHTPAVVRPVINELREPTDRNVLNAAMNAAEGLLEPLNEAIALRARLKSRFPTFSLPRVYENTDGFIDAGDFAAIAAEETTSLVGEWTRLDHDHILDALATLAEDPRVPIDIRQRAAGIALANELPDDRLSRHFSTILHSAFSSDEDRISAAGVMYLLDYRREEFVAMLKAKSERNDLEPADLIKARELFALSEPVASPLRRRCEPALATTAY